MFLLIPLLLVTAAFLILRSSAERPAAGQPRRLFAAWSAAGAAMTFSFLTGLSIGLFVLPFSTALLLWVAWRTVEVRDALGFVAGIGAVLLLVAFLNRAGDGVDPMPWLIAGLAVSGSAVLAYSLLRHRTARSAPRSVDESFDSRVSPQ